MSNAIQKLIQTPFGGSLGDLRPADLRPWKTVNETLGELRSQNGARPPNETTINTVDRIADIYVQAPYEGTDLEKYNN